MVSGMSLPSKLQKMKERVKRERSANAVNDENRDGSLYGRRKIAGALEQECEKLRESYNIHRKNGNKDRSVSGLRSSQGVLSNGGTSFLQKHNFKEDPFDQQNEDLDRSRGSFTFVGDQDNKSSSAIAL